MRIVLVLVIPQGPSLSPLIFLIHNVDLINIYNSPYFPATSIGLVDDANFLTFGKSTEKTCSVPNNICKCCLTWGDVHGAHLTSHKYVHVYFVKKKKSFPTAPLELLTFTLHTSPLVQVLSLILDSKLFLHPHKAHIKLKLRT